MVSRLLTTKFYVPQTHPNLVPRPRLSERLREGMGRKLTLISAPAGFGKTTLLSEWRMIHLESERALAWVSLDGGDNDPARFLSYLVGALRTVEAGVGEAALVALSSPQPRPIEAVVTALVNDLAAIPRDFALVLDDYHAVEAPPVHDVVGFLIEHMPPQMHLIISSRTDPPLPLARLRARGQLAELRAADLRFTVDEAAAFLNDVMGLALAARDVAALEARTEGWVAGLHLAALSMWGREDAAGFVSAFTGSNRHVLDYLAEEVLERQPEGVRTFLLETSVLDRLSGPLCDVVAGSSDGQEMLEALEKANLFIVPLDDERRWYRYHHLFSDFLRHRLRRIQPDGVLGLHRRAAEWYESHGFVEDAIGHALAAGDEGRAARLVEQNTEAVVMRSEGATLLRWLEALPEELVRSRPRLSVGYAIASLFGGRLDVVEPLLQDAERALEGSPEVSAESPPQTGAGGWLADIPGCIAVIRGDLARMRGDVPRATELARRALVRLPERTGYLRSKAAWNLGVTSWMRGDLAAAEGAFDEIVTGNRSANNAAYLPLLATYGPGPNTGGAGPSGRGGASLPAGASGERGGWAAVAGRRLGVPGDGGAAARVGRPGCRGQPPRGGHRARHARGGRGPRGHRPHRPGVAEAGTGGRGGRPRRGPQGATGRAGPQRVPPVPPAGTALGAGVAGAGGSSGGRALGAGAPRRRRAWLPARGRARRPGAGDDSPG